jgi:hypothetical protein
MVTQLVDNTVTLLQPDLVAAITAYLAEQNVVGNLSNITSIILTNVSGIELVGLNPTTEVCTIILPAN